MKDLLENEKIRKAAVSTAKGALYTYKANLRTKMVLADAALSGVDRINKKYEKKPTHFLIQKRVEEENKNMKNFIALVAVLAAAGATMGATGYYLYKKSKEQADYDDVIYDKELDEDNYINYEVYDEKPDFVEEIQEEKESFVDTAKEVLDAVGAVVDGVKGTVSDVVDTVSEFIDTALDK